MAKKCWRVDWTNCDGSKNGGYYCSSTMEWITTGGHICGTGYFLAPDLNWKASTDSELAGTFSQVSCSFCSNCCVDSISPNQKYDCINGGCVPKITYSTPGVFANLAACESGCAKNSNCTGECVSAPEIAALQQAANNLQAKNCK